MRRAGVAAVLLFTIGCGGGGGSAGGDASSFCNELKTQRQSTSSVTDAEATAALDRLLAVAPSEIKPEMDQLKAFNSLVTQASSDSSKVAELSSSSAQVEATLAKVTTFVKDKCGVDLTNNSSKFSTVASSIN